MLKYLITGINPIPCVSAHTKYTQNFSKYFTKVFIRVFLFNFNMFKNNRTCQFHVTYLQMLSLWQRNQRHLILRLMRKAVANVSTRTDTPAMVW